MEVLNLILRVCVLFCHWDNISPLEVLPVLLCAVSCCLRFYFVLLQTNLVKSIQQLDAVFLGLDGINWESWVDDLWLEILKCLR